jgi:hypothetical protein
MRLDKDYAQKRKSNTRWWRVYPMIFFELLVMQWLFNLSVGVAPLVVDETELQVKDGSPFEGFFNLGM